MNERSSLSMRAAWILAVGTVIAAVGTSAVVVSLTSSRPAVGPRSEVGSDGQLRALSEEIARLREVLERAEQESSSSPVHLPPVTSEGERLPVDPASGMAIDRFEAAIARLETTLRDELGATRAAMTGSDDLFRSAERRTEVDWAGWNEIYAVYQGDEQKARDMIRLLTTDQLLARFGPPKTVASRETHTMWYYYDAPTGEPLNVTLKIIDGYVTELYMEP